ncbi:hypothetical protein LUB13_04415 [Lactobacillus delbrueckii subsp. lactis]|uniref:hypothetical protein n=1 Tax=Lactobacillus delbrueckii TaxID=1584 RepID=UPI001E54BB59|nr:hypothetical protein [Lactobacillus delbrueckii]MCD9218657.1 hypothetical protein [Lactobacillus delbrueckii subsp. lactis]
MKEKNWLTWLTALALVVGFVAMGASIWLSVQAAKQTQRNSQLAGQLYQASRTKSQEAFSVKKRLDKLASDNSSLKKKNSRLAKENQALKQANQDLLAASAAAGLNVWETEEKSGKLQLEIDNQTGQAVSDLLVLAVAASGRVTLNSLPSYFPVGGAKPRYFYRKKVAIGGAEGSLTGVYWFKGNRGQIEKIGSQAHFKKLFRQISLNKLEESPLPVKKTKTEKKKMSKKTTKKTEKQSSKKKAE